MSRNRIAKSYLKQAVVQTTLLNYRTFHRNHRKLVIKQSVDKFSLKAQRLAPLHELDELLGFSQKVFTGQQQYLAQAFQELCRSDSEEDDETIILADSLKSTLLFLLRLCDFKKPTSIALNENGTFQLRWKQNDSYLTTLRFQKNNRLDYVIFLPSQHAAEPIVLNGNMNLFDFIEFFSQNASLTAKLLRG